MARTSSSSAMTSMRTTLLAGQPGRDDISELLAAVFLEEVTGAGDGRVRLTGAARHLTLKRVIGTARDRVLVGERGEERLVPRTQCLPRPAVCVGGRIGGRRRNQHRELARARLVAIVGKRRVVRGKR